MEVGDIVQNGRVVGNTIVNEIKNQILPVKEGKQEEKPSVEKFDEDYCFRTYLGMLKPGPYIDLDEIVYTQDQIKNHENYCLELLEQAESLIHFNVAKAFRVRYYEKIKVISPKGPIFFYETEDRLWHYHSRESFGGNVINRYFVPFIGELINRFQVNLLKASNDDIRFQLGVSIKKFKSLKDSLGNVTYLRKVTEAICDLGSNPDDSLLFDRSAGFLPVKGNKVVNMATGELLPRTKLHYFTLEVDVNYDVNKFKENVEYMDKFMSTYFLEDRSEDKEKTLFFRKWMGYNMTGLNNRNY